MKFIGRQIDDIFPKIFELASCPRVAALVIGNLEQTIFKDAFERFNFFKNFIRNLS
jgi:hypothetical protein